MKRYIDTGRDICVSDAESIDVVVDRSHSVPYADTSRNKELGPVIK
jgi:hypothetical protein